MTEIRVPTLGESVSEATIGKWFKKPGDAVRKDEPLLELETDKVTLEVNAPEAGVLAEITAADGATVGVGALLGQITVGTSASTPAATAAGKEAPAMPGKPEAVPAAGQAPIQEKAATTTAMPPAPAASKMMAETGVAVDSGSGKRGQVLKEDVMAAVAKASAAPVPAPAPAPIPTPTPASAPAAVRAAVTADDASREERVKMSKLRQTIARRLKESQNTAAMLTTFNEVDMTEVMALRAKYKEIFEKKHGVKLGFMGLFVKACVQALKELPGVNGEIDGTDLVYKNYYHIGIAVGTDKGLVVPVVRNADQLSIAGVEKTISDLGKRARDGSLTVAEMQGGTFTITNGGIYGSLMSTPILNAPQSGILGMHKIQERPMVVGGQVVVRSMMYLALSYDHRIVDGKEAVTFLVRVKESLEDPARLVMDL